MAEDNEREKYLRRQGRGASAPATMGDLADVRAELLETIQAGTAAAGEASSGSRSTSSRSSSRAKKTASR